MEEPAGFALQLGTGSQVIQSDVSSSRLDSVIFSPVNARERLPERYPIDSLQLMVQSPFRVFAYWEVTAERIQAALTPFPKEEHRSFRLILKWIEIGQGPGQSFDSGGATEWWFPTRPGHRYRAELCLHSEEFGAVPVRVSNEVETPRASVAENAAGFEEPRETTELLSRLVELTGLKQELRKTEELVAPNQGGAETQEPIQSSGETRLKPKISRSNTNRPSSFLG